MRHVVIGFAVAMGFACLANRAHAGIVIDVSQVGANVVMNGSGSVELSTLNRLGDGATFITVDGAANELEVGATPTGAINIYGTLTGPASFGTAIGVDKLASSGSGDVFGVVGPPFSGFPVTVLYLPINYVSGSAPSATDTYLNTTIAASA